MADTFHEIVASMTPEEKRILEKKFNEKEDDSYKGMSITFFFPEETGLSPVTVSGQVPPEGARIQLRSYGPKTEPEYDYSIRYAWKVASVIYSVTAQGNSKDRLLYPNHYSAEVMLEEIKNV